MPENKPGSQSLNRNESTGRKKPVENNAAEAGNISGIEIRMLPPFIRNNRQLKIWPFPGYAKLYCLTTVISDVANELTGVMDLGAFARIGKNDYLPVNKTIYYWQKDVSCRPAPSQVHIMCSIFKSREALRDTDRILAMAQNDSEYKVLMDRLGSVLADTASFAMVTDMTMKAAAIINRYMGKTEDMPVATVVDSFTRLHGDWDRPGLRQVNMSAKNADFSFELAVHNGNSLATARTVQGIPLFDIPGEGFHTMTNM